MQNSSLGLRSQRDTSQCPMASKFVVIRCPRSVFVPSVPFIAFVCTVVRVTVVRTTHSADRRAWSRTAQLLSPLCRYLRCGVWVLLFASVSSQWVLSRLKGWRPGGFEALLLLPRAAMPAFSLLGQFPFLSYLSLRCFRSVGAIKPSRQANFPLKTHPSTIPLRDAQKLSWRTSFKISLIHGA